MYPNFLYFCKFFRKHAIIGWFIDEEIVRSLEGIQTIRELINRHSTGTLTQWKTKVSQIEGNYKKFNDKRELVPVTFEDYILLFKRQGWYILNFLH